MSFIGKIFGVAIDVVKIPVSVVKDGGHAICGEDVDETAENLKELAEDLRDL